MDFDFTPEQQQFGDALRRWVAQDYTFEQRKAIIATPAGVSADAWAALAELGMTALPVPQAYGGFDGTAIDMLVVMQELGRGLVVEPYLATMLGAELLRRSGAFGHLLERVATGELTLACALGEGASRHDLFDIGVTAQAQDDGAFRITGVKTAVLHGAQAGALIVSARSSGAQRDRDGISLFVLAADTPGISITDCRSIDGQRVANVYLDGVITPADSLLVAAGEGWPLLDAAGDYGAGLLCFEALGVMDALFAATLEYVKTRQQFGAPIGRFQALQHRMADMYIHLEQARSMAILAAVRLAEDAQGGDAAAALERRRCVSAAKFRVGQAATFVGQQAVQLHGGMGVSNELPAAHYFKRLSCIGLTLGDADHHLERFISLSVE